MAIIIDGKLIAAQVKEEIAAEVLKMKEQGLRAPALAVVMVGNEGASATYVASKVKSCQQVGFESIDLHFPEDISEETLLQTIQDLNNNPGVDGFIVQLPLPSHINEDKVIAAVNPDKDVDGFHPSNVGKMALNIPAFVSATPAGIMELIARYKIETDGKEIVVLGRSNIVGTPISILLSRKAYPGNGTVTLCHSRTKNLKEVCSRADILIVAIGKPEFVTADMVKPGATVIDVGIHRIPSTETKSGFRIIGDVQFESVSQVAGYITPVPGGVGLMTIVSLLQNTLKAAKEKRKEGPTA
ncbi:MAG: bifunctional methylenetetrahydrofolate dehydrogenase/methenyltetrahydrofolate cyclohydrolase FolD [Bacteroidales bacterium]|nr:bifunctional methylenetetrahydrofolate dehydrogenase/methenyltetrahydrofolate cyclohydrolase FolD [Bacteroidales bacterium]